MPKQYYKVWFSNGAERTAKLVLDTERFPKGKTSIQAYSRLFPFSESPKMKRIITTGLYNSPEEALHERSREMDLLLPAEDKFFKPEASR